MRTTVWVPGNTTGLRCNTLSLRASIVAIAMLFSLPVPSLAQSLWTPADTVTFSDSTTAATVILARARHYHSDSVIQNYRATAVTRIDAGLGRRRFGLIPPFVALETLARVTWQYPNDLRLEILGKRDTTIFAGADIDAMFDKPWFVPRSVGDSIRLLEGDLLDRAAVHPLAEGAEEFYRYAIVDSVEMVLPGLAVRAINIRVEPKDEGPALVAGDMWIDADTYEVVRLAVLFLGSNLWSNPDAGTPEDSAESRRENDIANRILRTSADLEYSLFEGKYWLPFRQLVSLTVEIPWVFNVTIPVRFLTEFSDYEVNALPPIAFTIPVEELWVPDKEDPDRMRWRRQVYCNEDFGAPQGVANDSTPHQTEDCGRYRSRMEVGYIHAGGDPSGRWEIVVPGRDSLENYVWDTPLVLGLNSTDEARIRETMTTLAHIAEDLPADMVGRTRSSLAWEELADMVRFNRVQGWSFGAGYMIRPGPAFTSVFAEARLGLGDLRPTGLVAWRRDSPEGLFEAALFRTVSEPDPWARGQSLGNSLNAVFASHDDSDYFLGLGGGLSYEFYSPSVQTIKVAASLERHTSMTTESGAIFNSLRINPPVFEGSFLRGVIQQQWSFRAGTATTGIEGIRGEGLQAGRAWSSLKLRFPALRDAVVTGRVGASVGDVLPQMNYRVGGPQTVRGRPYGERVGVSMWSVQLDVPLNRRSAATPVLFADVGNLFGQGSPLVGAGLGWSLLNGWFRPNLSYGINPDAGFRLDLLFGAPR